MRASPLAQLTVARRDAVKLPDDLGSLPLGAAVGRKLAKPRHQSGPPRCDHLAHGFHSALHGALHAGLLVERQYPLHHVNRKAEYLGHFFTLVSSALSTMPSTRARVPFTTHAPPKERVKPTLSCVHFHPQQWRPVPHSGNWPTRPRGSQEGGGCVKTLKSQQEGELFSVLPFFRSRPQRYSSLD